MCFRPAEVAAPQVCPECGKEFAVIAGIMQKECPFCGAPMPESGQGVPAPAAPSAPGMPSATPGMPGTPSAPKAPGA